MRTTWPEETQLFPNFHADQEGNILHSLHREFGDKHVRSVIHQRFKSQQIVWISLIISTTTSGLSGGSDWCPVKLSVFPVLLLWISPDQTTRESRESPLPAGGRLSCCLWNIMCAVNEKVAVLDWAGGFLDTRRHRLMFSLLRWLCCVAVSGTGPDGPELLSAASGPSAAEVRILLINSRLHQHQGSPCAPCCWGFISSRCNKLSQNSRLCDPEAVCSALLSGSVCCFPAWCSSAPHRILHLLPCERCCSHFLPLHLLLLLMLLCQLCWSVRCLSEL